MFLQGLLVIVKHLINVFKARLVLTFGAKIMIHAYQDFGFLVPKITH